MSSDDGPRANSVDAALEQMGRLSRRDQPLVSLLQQVAEFAKSDMLGDPETSPGSTPGGG